jgi:hypothetical protein
MRQEAWDVLRDIAPSISAARPTVGQMVRVVEGKHRGTVGRITWHGRDKFTHAFRYGDAMQHHMTDMMGAWGFRVRIQPEQGEPFFVAAERVIVCVEASA